MAFLGASCFGLYCLRDSDRIPLLDAARDGGITVLRIFLTEIDYNNWKGCQAFTVPDLEQDGLGQYNDRVLELVDSLMVECLERGIKLTIAVADTCAGRDRYFDRYGSGQGFYSSDEAQRIFDDRIRHVLQHRNPHLGNRPWAELSEVIWSFQAHNEPQGHMNLCRPTFNAEKARVFKSLLPAGSSILVSTGGRTDCATSLANESEWTSPDIDVVCLHSYEDRGSIMRAVEKGKKLAKQHGKLLIVEETGFQGTNKAAEIAALTKSLRSADVPFFYWQIASVGKGAEDFEISPSERDSWHALTAGWSRSSSFGSASGTRKFGSSLKSFVKQLGQ